MARVKGKAAWAYTKNTDKKYEECWRINVVISAEEAKKMKELGVRIQKTDELKDPISAAYGPYFVKITRYVEKRGKAKGQKNEAPIVMDSDNNPIDVYIGNGSDVIVGFRAYNWSWGGKSGVGTDLEKIKVINLIEYEGAGGGEIKQDSSNVEDYSEEEIKDKDDDELF